MHVKNAPVRVLVATAACVLMAVAPAAAVAAPDDRFPAGGAAMTDAWDQAVGYWQGMPCRGQVRIGWTAMSREYNAIARWTAGDPARPDTFTNCSITFNTEQPYDYPMLCSIMTHEVGHLLGQPHGGNQEGSVMSETYYGPVGPCGPGALPAPEPEAWDVEQEWASTATAVSKRSRRSRCVRRLRAERVTAKVAQRRCSTKKRATPLR